MINKASHSFRAGDLAGSHINPRPELSQLARVDPQIADNVAELRRIIAFRNILVHGYAAIDYATVWRPIEDKLPELQSNLTMLLRAADPSQDPSAG